MSTGVFDAYAAYYDLLNHDKDYNAEAAYVDALLKRYRPGTVRLLELGSGTGVHAERLARSGYSVAGVDLSPEMVAQANARRAGLPSEIAARLEFHAADATSARLEQQFDAVISLFHVFSYQTSNAALQAVFESAAAHLPKGGLLCFDYWYGPAVLTQKPDVRVRRMEDERTMVRRIAEPELRSSANMVRVSYDIEVTDKTSGARRAFAEVHDMRYLFVPEIELLARGLFDVRLHAAWLGDRLPGTSDWAAVCVLERCG
jgi:SAM-dependent methyltransferase